MSTINEIEDRLLMTLEAMECWAMIQSVGRVALPPVICYPACFVFWDGDEAAAEFPRPIDTVDFKVIIQVQNYSSERIAASDCYTLNDRVRDAIRGKVLEYPDIEPFACLSRRCTDYDDSDGMIEYTHTYRTRLYQPVVMQP